MAIFGFFCVLFWPSSWRPGWRQAVRYAKLAVGEASNGDLAMVGIFSDVVLFFCLLAFTSGVVIALGSLLG